jgi:hypothetical protein
MVDAIFGHWLRAQHEDALALTRESDRLRVLPAGEAPALAYVVELDCRGLIRSAQGEVQQHEGFHIWIGFREDHLRRVDPLRLAMCKEPLWHPNALATPIGSMICPGAARPGVGLTALIEQYYSILTWQKVNRADALNPEACEWSRNWDGKPIDDRPLRRRKLQIRLTPAAVEGGGG